jgi:hypothetical protein
MISFQETLSNWHDFYMLVGTAAVTLLGLLFIGLSINIDQIRKNANIDIQEFAAQSGNCLFYTLLIALAILIPGESKVSLGLSMSLLGLLGGVGTLAHLAAARRKKRVLGRSTIARRFVLSMVALAILILAGIALQFSVSPALYALVMVVVLLLLSATQNAWDLLLTIRQAPE